MEPKPNPEPPKVTDPPAEPPAPPAAPTAEEIAALQAEAAAAVAMREQIATLTAEKAARAEADAEKARKAKIDEGGILEVLEAERAEKAALALRVEELNGKVTSYQDKETARLDAISQANKVALEALPEKYRALVPSDLAPEATRTQIEAIRAIAVDDTERPAGGRSAAGGGGGKPPESIPEECAAEAAKYGKTPEYWHEKIWKPRMKRLARNNANN